MQVKSAIPSCPSLSSCLYLASFCPTFLIAPSSVPPSLPFSFPPLQPQELKPGFCSVIDNIQHEYIHSLGQQGGKEGGRKGGVRPFHPVLQTRFVVEGQELPWAEAEEEEEGGEEGKRGRV